MCSHTVLSAWRVEEFSADTLFCRRQHESPIPADEVIDHERRRRHAEQRENNSRWRPTW